jgi:hypothetical protein
LRRPIWLVPWMLLLLREGWIVSGGCGDGSWYIFEFLGCQGLLGADGVRGASPPLNIACNPGKDGQSFVL